jgi:hypothetical protein
LTLAKEALRLGEHPDDPNRFAQIASLVSAGIIHQNCGEPGAAEDLFRESRTLYAERGFSFNLGCVRVLRGKARNRWNCARAPASRSYYSKPIGVTRMRAILAEFDHWFTEGFDTADPEDVKAVTQRPECWTFMREML